jgi:hypothetical protein
MSNSGSWHNAYEEYYENEAECKISGTFDKVSLFSYLLSISCGTAARSSALSGTCLGRGEYPTAAYFHLDS